MPSTTSIRLPEEVAQRLDVVANALRRSKSWVILEAVKDYLDRAEHDTQRWRETLIALESVKAGRTIDGETVDDWLASWGSGQEREPPR